MRKTKAEWAKIVERYKRSGLSIRRFCEQNGIGEQSLRNWVSKLNLGPVTADDNYPGFIEIPSTASMGPTVASPHLGLLIHFPDGISIEVPPTTDHDLLERVLVLLRKKV
jgi:hypothetical protein